MSNKKPLFSERFKNILSEIGKKTINDCVSTLYAIEAAYKINMFDEEYVSKSISMLDYRHVNGDILISYLAIGKTPEYTVNDKWARKNRQQGKIGKTILTFINHYCELLQLIKPSASEVEKFVNMFKSLISSDNYEFKLVKNKDIAFYYNEANYYQTSNGGYTLFNSCMRYEECQKYFDIYTTNDDCELLIMFDKSLSSTKIVGRALVWSQNDKKYVDRRYFCLDEYETAMIEYIKSQKWSYKSVNTYDDDYNKDFYEFDPTLNEYDLHIDCSISIPIKFTPEYYPYMDTLKYYDQDMKLLTNDDDKVNDFIILNSADGGYENDDEIVNCEICGARIHIDDSLYVDFTGYCCSDCATYDYFGNAANYNNLVTVIGNDETYLIHVDDLRKYAINYKGEWYAIPGTMLDGYPYLVQYDKDDYTTEEFNAFLENKELINNEYAIII